MAMSGIRPYTKPQVNTSAFQATDLLITVIEKSKRNNNLYRKERKNATQIILTLSSSRGVLNGPKFKCQLESGTG